MFLLGTSGVGGAATSTAELAAELSRVGHSVVVLRRDRRDGLALWLHDLLTDATVRFRSPLIAAIDRQIGRRPRVAGADGHDLCTSRVPENALPAVLARFRPDVVVGASIDRVGWRRATAILREWGIPSVLYIREASALGHLTISRTAADLVLANAASHAEQARSAGVDCRVVPSLVRVSTTPTSRQVALLVNPIESHGVDVAIRLAEERPDIRFVFQESWPLNRAATRQLHVATEAHPNIELRRRTSDSQAIYRDARLLLVPHRLDNRPRVILEAQARGVPALGTDWPGIREATGPGGVLLRGDDPETWLRELGALWDSPERYAHFAAEARKHAQRRDIQPEAVVASFLNAISVVMRGSRPEPSGTSIARLWAAS